MHYSRVTEFPVLSQHLLLMPSWNQGGSSSTWRCWSSWSSPLFLEWAQLKTRHSSWHEACWFLLVKAFFLFLWFSLFFVFVFFSAWIFMICPSEKAHNTVHHQTICIKNPSLDLAAVVCWCSPQLPLIWFIHRDVLALPVIWEMNVGII